MNRTTVVIATRMSEDSMTGKLNACNYAWKSSKEKEGKNNCQDEFREIKKNKILWMNKWWITLMRMFCCLIKIGSSSNDHWKEEEEEKTSDKRRSPVERKSLYDRKIAHVWQFHSVFCSVSKFCVTTTLLPFLFIYFSSWSILNTLLHIANTCISDGMLPIRYGSHKRQR